MVESMDDWIGDSSSERLLFVVMLWIVTSRLSPNGKVTLLGMNFD